jgi:dTDP-4-dehydrorhamnose reductase
MPLLFTDEFRCPIFVEDLADALVEIAVSDFVGVLNVAGPQRLSRYEFGLILARRFGVAPKFQPALSASHLRTKSCELG